METLEYGPAPESAGVAMDWLESHGRHFALFIDGEWREPVAGERFDSFNPANEAVLASVAQGGEQDIDAAVRAARAALPAWQALDGHQRARFLYALARQIQKNSRLFAVLETLDNGKPIRETRDIDVPLVARHFYHHAGWAQLRDDEFPGYGPVGVVGQIIPWNFPLLMLAWKVAPALAGGNTVVLKPAEYTPLTALLFAEICQRIGLPAGVLNVVTGDGRTGEALVGHPDVDKIAFTGSTEVGRIIRERTAGTGKRLTLELGGKSPFVVFEDADLDSVVEGVVDAIWFNQGQVCCAGSRILVQEGVAQRLIDRLRARMETLRVGDPLEKTVDIGAIIAPVQLKRIETLVEGGRQDGANVWQPSWGCPQEGWFYPPTLITDVAPSADVARIEIFGPVVVLMTFRTPAEAVSLANNTRYGLAASVWSENINLALDIAPKIRAGTVWINSTNLFDAASGFGGYRESGFGREGGREGMWEYLAGNGRQGSGWGREAVPPAGDGSGAGYAPAPPSTGTEPHAGPPFSGSPGPPVGVEDEGKGNPPVSPSPTPPVGAGGGVGIDRTAKLYIGGKQARPDGGYSQAVVGAGGRVLGEVGTGNRKDVRNAVEAAHAAVWAGRTAHQRAQVLYYLAENLAARRDEFIARIRASTGGGAAAAAAEFDATMRRLFTYAAWADKWDGAVHHVPLRGVTLAMPEPWGVMGIVCPDAFPLLGFVSSVIPAVALGNAVVALPSAPGALVATDLYQVLDTSDVPAGVINVITGPRETLAQVLAGHDDVSALWCFPPMGDAAALERLSAGNMKPTWIDRGARDWLDPAQGSGPEFLRHASQVKNIWIPYGE
ncbi:MAG: aldehyde dehydrogenase family protein [Gemmatimonadota bacterium]